jgi:hypothetical protein
VENAGATTKFRSKPVADREALYRHRTSGHEMEDAKSRGVLRSGDRQETRANAANGDALVDNKLGTCQEMDCPLREGSESIVSPSSESTGAWRSEPGPLSFVSVTVMMSA